MIKESALKAAVSIFNGTLNAFKDAALDDRNKFTDEQRKELVAIIDKAFDKQNIEPSLAKINVILNEFGIVYSRCGGNTSIIEKNMINIKKKVK